jgi:hypothetical protein
MLPWTRQGRITLRDGGEFIPTSGPVGTLFQTQDKDIYVRTYAGIRKIEDGIVGRSLLLRHAFVQRSLRDRFDANMKIFLLLMAVVVAVLI